MLCPHCGKETDKPKELTPDEMKQRIAELEKQVAEAHALAYVERLRCNAEQNPWVYPWRRPYTTFTTGTQCHA